ncbi:vWA domain-containing protein [Anaerofustis stercorihominis]|uniref:vWA domain-containing protein n=1 Tax=Anaerofustis stercorihominis TaxID=214853 RepID=UPI0011074F20|nr:vWA domain-containing protein [Anaerofustis stercorihominis]
MKKLLGFVLSIMMLISMLPTVTAAEQKNITSPEVTHKATNLDSNYISEVTMTVPAEEYRQTMDIVFVLDGSTSSDASDLANDAANMLNNLTKISNIDVNAGLVIFGGSNPILYSSDSMENISDESVLNNLMEKMTDKSYNGQTGRSGSNLQAGIEKARSLLKSGVAESDNKYLVLLTDGGARMWVNDNGQALAQLPYLNNWNTNEDFIARYINGKLNLRTFGEIINDANSGKDIGKYSITEDKKSDKNYLVSNLEPGMDVNTSMDYYSNLESATYFAGQSIIEMKENNEANVIWVDYPYNKGTKFGDYTESFKSWMADKGYVTRYDSDSISDPFAEVNDTLIYYMGKGSKVENIIGYGSDNYGNSYDFDMVNLDNLKLTIGTKTLTTTKISDNKYAFGQKDNDGNYPFELIYYPNGKNDNGKDSFDLLINTNVKMDDFVKLHYNVKLTNPQTINGTYGVYDEDGSESLDALKVSKEATLYPINSQGEEEDSVPFSLPTVSYTVDNKSQTVSVNIASMTVYTGGKGYEGVVMDQQGYVAASNKNTLPEPGYTIDLPENVDKWLKEQLGVSDDTTLDISKYLTFTYNDGKETRKWSIEKYDQHKGNSSQVNGRYLYRLVSSKGQDPIRLEFRDEDGNIMISDDFTVDQDTPNKTYTMSIYAGALNQGLVKAEIKLPNSDSSYSFDINVVSAELKIRGVVSDEENPTTEIVTGEEPKEAVSEVTAQVPSETKYYYKGSDNQVSSIEVADSSAVNLLVDDVIPSATSTLEEASLEEFDVLPDNYNIEMKYLDLVYTNNSNAVVGANEPITIYWPYPEGTDENTEFFIVHYKGLDRNDNEALTDNYEMELFSENQKNEKYKLTNTDNGIQITVDSFSPFALIWEDTSASGTKTDNTSSSNSSSLNTPNTEDKNMVGAWILLFAVSFTAVTVCVRKEKVNK